MSKAADAFEQYLGSLSNEEWNALVQRVRPKTNVEAVIAQLHADPSVIASLRAQAQALQGAIDTIDAQIAADEAATNAWLHEAGAYRDPAARPDPAVVIWRKQERYRLHTTLEAVQTEITERTGK